MLKRLIREKVRQNLTRETTALIALLSYSGHQLSCTSHRPIPASGFGPDPQEPGVQDQCIAEVRDRCQVSEEEA